MLTTVTPPTHSQIRAVAQQMPAAPRVLAGLFTLLANPHSSLSAIADLLMQDASLAARVMRMGNSVALGKNDSVTTVDEAIQRVGLGRIYMIVGLAANESLGKLDLGWHRISSQKLTRYNLGMAISAELVAHEIGANPRIAYTAALMRTIGLAVLDDLSKPHNTRPAPDADLAEHDRTVFGIDFHEVTKIALHEWNFPEIVTVAASTATHLESGQSPEALAVCLADALLRDTPFGLPGCAIAGSTLVGSVIETRAPALRDEITARLLASEA